MTGPGSGRRRARAGARAPRAAPRRAPAGSAGSPASSRPRTPATADLTALAARLTPRDRQLCRLVLEHRVLTTDQVTALLFPSANAAQHRLLALARLGMVDRFRPLLPRGEGAAPWHYVLGPAGAAMLAAEQATTVRSLTTVWQGRGLTVAGRS